ncbi:MAG: lipopolysaccharide biosynthesis protein RfbH [Acidiferrobacteraceae bacterium]|nr:lipopolysaccharide biosynthesis protein RfbH [Acidiferrobacteraceae bacterium]
MKPTPTETREAIHNLAQDYGRYSVSAPDFVPGTTPIPPSGKVITSEDLEFMIEAVLDGWLTTGRFNDAFEQELADYLGVGRVLTTNSGSSANLLALSALTSPKLGDRGLKPGDEVITVAAGFPTTVNPIIVNGLIPVFIDVDIPTYNIDVNQIEAALSSKTRAIMVAHTLGNPFQIDQVTELARKHNLWLIEDCCDALGSEFRGRRVGSFGDIGTLSFYPAHHITMGEGGAVFTSDAELAVLIESFRDWGRDCYCAPGKENTCGKRFGWQLVELPIGYDHKYIYSHVGYNLKITDIQAACGLSQLKKIEEFVQKRRQNFNHLSRRLASLEDFLILPQSTIHSEPAWFGFPLTIKETAGTGRKDLLEYLDQRRIGTRLLFAGNLTKQPYFSKIAYRVASTLRNSDVIMSSTFWLGVYPGLSTEMLDYVADELEQYFGIGF